MTVKYFSGLNLKLEFAFPSLVRSTLSSCYGNKFKLLSWELWCTYWCRCAVKDRCCKLRILMLLPQLLQEQTLTLHLLCGRYCVRDLGTQMKRQGPHLEELRLSGGGNRQTRGRTRAGPLAECQHVLARGAYGRELGNARGHFMGLWSLPNRQGGWTKMMFPQGNCMGRS